jgi:ubiquinone/menaquinone biosynthesis C-methylase UbiE
VTLPEDHRGFVTGVARAYGATGEAWSSGPARIYDRLAEVLVAASPVPVAGRTVLDVGAGTGAASLALAAAGARVVALDLAPGMLRSYRLPGAAGLGRVAAEATELPVATGSVGGFVAAFALNHLPAPADGFREAARVGEQGAPVLVAAYADDDDHPAKHAVDEAAAAEGWQPEPWCDALRAGVTAHLATVGGMAAAAAVPGLTGEATIRRVDLPEIDPAAMVGWRMGMAQVAPFLAEAGPGVRRRVARRALAALGPNPPPVRRSIVVYAGMVTETP